MKYIFTLLVVFCALQVKAQSPVAMPILYHINALYPVQQSVGYKLRFEWTWSFMTDGKYAVGVSHQEMAFCKTCRRKNFINFRRYIPLRVDVKVYIVSLDNNYEKLVDEQQFIP